MKFRLVITLHLSLTNKLKLWCDQYFYIEVLSKCWHDVFYNRIYIAMHWSWIGFGWQPVLFKKQVMQRSVVPLAISQSKSSLIWLLSHHPCLLMKFLTLAGSPPLKPKEGRKRNRVKIICNFRLTRLSCVILGTSTSTNDSPEKVSKILSGFLFLLFWAAKVVQNYFYPSKSFVEQRTMWLDDFEQLIIAAFYFRTFKQQKWL